MGHLVPVSDVDGVTIVSPPFQTEMDCQSCSLIEGGRFVVGSDPWLPSNTITLDDLGS